MEYYVFRFDVDPPSPGSEILIAHLGYMGFETFEQDDNGFNAYIPSHLVAGLALNDLQFPGFAYQYTASRVPEKNWNAEWEKNFEPVIVDDLVCIRAPFHQLAHNCRHEVVIMPQMSFGTGHHQTTRMMCRALFDLTVSGKAVLDMGTGTGVLAILAAKLGASRVVGIDIDQWSVENAVSNCSENGCGQIDIRLGDTSAIRQDERFDIILANINRNILLKQWPDYVRHSSPGASIVLSGFFTTDAVELEQAVAEHGFKRSGQYSEGEWAALVFVSSRSAPSPLP